MNWANCRTIEKREGRWVFRDTDVEVVRLFTVLDGGYTLQKFSVDFGVPAASVDELIIFLLETLEAP